MHDRLTDLLGVEVVGEVTRIGDALFDVALGRLALPDVEPGRTAELLERLRRHFGEGLQVTDRLHLRSPDPLLRGLLEVSLRTEPGGTAYLLQLTTPALLALYHRRFLLEPGLLGDLRGVLCDGLARLVAAGEGPLRLLSRFEELQDRARELVQATLEQSLAGRSFDPAPGLAELVPRLREAWRLIPWPLRQGLTPCWKPEQERIAPHDRVMRRTLLLAVEQESGKPLYQYVHQHHSLEDYDQVLTWLTEIHRAMLAAFASPAYATAIARASAPELFLDCHPGLRGLVGPPLPEPASD